MGSLSLRKLLYLIALAPLTAFLWLSILQVSDSYDHYRHLKHQMSFQRIASAGGQLAQAVPAEAFATPQNIVERRQAVDQAIDAVKKAYDAWKAEGNADQTIDQTYASIMDKQRLWPSYRSNIDKNQRDEQQERDILQPTAGAGLDLVRRSAGTISDLELSRFIDGYHALMQVMEAGLMEIRQGETYLSGTALSLPRLKFNFHAKGLRDRYQSVMKEFLPADISKPITDFIDGPDGQFLAAVRKDMYDKPEAVKDDARLRRWLDASSQQAKTIGPQIAKTAIALNAAAEGKLASLRAQFIQSAVVALLVSILVIALCIMIVRKLSGMIRSVESRMKTLVEGDSVTSIPFSTRSDEIGDIARSVESFRLAAIRNKELEAEAEANRRLADEERETVQQRAEAEAEQRLTQATGALADGLHKLAAGDLLCEIETQFAPQFEPLRNDFNTSIRQLRGTLAAVQEAVTTVSGGAKEISSASDDLAKRTEQQAASLEETAAALEEITANVVSTSKRTADARNVVREARNRADQSGAVVRNAVVAMERIEESSRQINQIISVIDEIAFQTNLLALNAGVEAARAGEAGKGFAVVAQEVRELAQRSANAAKEIKQLINNSTVAVSEGVKLVSDTGEGLTAIEQLVQSVNAHMDAIATAAQEQSAGLGEVNTSVNHMDQATQQNAAMVEEMNAAGAGLAQESTHLHQLLARFHLGQPVATEGRGHASARSQPVSPRKPATAQMRSAQPVRRTAGNVAVAESWEEF